MQCVVSTFRVLQELPSSANIVEFILGSCERSGSTIEEESIMLLIDKLPSYVMFGLK